MKSTWSNWIINSKLPLLRGVFTTHTLTQVTTWNIKLKTLAVIFNTIRSFACASFEMLHFSLNFAYFLMISIFLLEKSILTLILELNIIHTTTTITLFSTVSACTKAFTILLQALWSRAWAWFKSISFIWLWLDCSLFIIIIIIYLKLISNYVIIFFINS